MLSICSKPANTDASSMLSQLASIGHDDIIDVINGMELPFIMLYLQKNVKHGMFSPLISFCLITKINTVVQNYSHNIDISDKYST